MVREGWVTAHSLPFMNLPVLPSRPSCTLCPLHQSAKSVGTPAIWLPTSLPPSPTTPIVVMLGRNPGRNENEKNEPFVGRSGKVLREGYLGGPDPIYRRATVYLFNTVRCYTPADAVPNWGTHTKPCFPHTLTDLEEVLCFGSARSTPSISGSSGDTGLSETPAIRMGSPPSDTLSIEPSRVALVCLGGLASQAFVNLALGEKRPKSQREALADNGREVVWEGHNIFLIHTFHPSYVLRSPNSMHAVAEHMELLLAWLKGEMVAPSQPVIVPPFYPES
jgi:uracil-DNA glycosylase